MKNKIKYERIEGALVVVVEDVNKRGNALFIELGATENTGVKEVLPEVCRLFQGQILFKFLEPRDEGAT
jgi:hypothetical protein